MDQRINGSTDQRAASAQVQLSALPLSLPRAHTPAPLLKPKAMTGEELGTSYVAATSSIADFTKETCVPGDCKGHIR
jgi:hypothetical protein